MKNTILITLILAVFCMAASASYAAKKSSGDLLREGLLGAGSGAVGGLASGAAGGDVWKGALAGAGVNIVGGILAVGAFGNQFGLMRDRI